MPVLPVHRCEAWWVQVTPFGSTRLKTETCNPKYPVLMLFLLWTWRKDPKDNGKALNELGYSWNVYARIIALWTREHVMALPLSCVALSK